MRDRRGLLAPSVLSARVLIGAGRLSRIMRPIQITILENWVRAAGPSITASCARPDQRHLLLASLPPADRRRMPATYVRGKTEETLGTYARCEAQSVYCAAWQFEGNTIVSVLGFKQFCDMF